MSRSGQIYPLARPIHYDIRCCSLSRCFYPPVPRQMWQRSAQEYQGKGLGAMQGGQRDAPKGWAPLQEWIEYTMQMALETEGADVGNNRANGGASRQPALTRRQRRRLQRPTQQQSGAAKPRLTNQAAGVARGADARPRVRLDKQQSAAAAMARPATSQPEGNGAET